MYAGDLGNAGITAAPVVPPVHDAQQRRSESHRIQPRETRMRCRFSDMDDKCTSFPVGVRAVRMA